MCNSELSKQEFREFVKLKIPSSLPKCRRELDVARRTSEFVQVLPNAIRCALGGWLVMHEDLKTTRRVRLLFDHFAVGFDGLRQGTPMSAAHEFRP
jgi:hypothetical protein